jgi:UDP-N-acetylglucosamine 1-carboxyvinyltransferase
VGQATTDGQTLKLKAAEIVDTAAPYEMVSLMRASFWVLAPLLARCGEAKISLPVPRNLEART